MNYIHIKFIISLFLIGLIMGCEVTPEPISFGSDACSHCKMTIMDVKYGAELVTEKGKVYKFDDISCMIKFQNEGQLGDNKISHHLVVDFEAQYILIDATSANYVFSDQLKSPMGSQIAAVRNLDTLGFLSKHIENGKFLTWSQVKTKFE